MDASEQEAIFCRWVDEHLGLMLKVVRAYAASDVDREDLFQDILVQLWSSVPGFRGQAKETTWIYRVSFNTALAWGRGEHRRRKRYRPLLGMDLPAASHGPPAASSNHELLERLYAAIHRLAKVDASLILMHLDGLSYREMAEVLGISENHIGVKLTRIRKELAQMLGGCGDEL